MQNVQRSGKLGIQEVDVVRKVDQKPRFDPRLTISVLDRDFFVVDGQFSNGEGPCREIKEASSTL